MLHLLKYQFLQTIRSRSIMFWALAFPLILGALFYVSFGNTGLAGTGETDWEPVPVAIVTVDSSSANAASFLTFLNETDQDMIDIHSYKTEKAAKKALRREEISGIYYVKSVSSLTIASNGINQSILSSLLDSYEKNADMIRDIATQHPEKLSDALASPLGKSADFSFSIQMKLLHHCLKNAPAEIPDKYNGKILPCPEHCNLPEYMHRPGCRKNAL